MVVVEVVKALNLEVEVVVVEEGTKSPEVVVVGMNTVVVVVWKGQNGNLKS